MSDETEGNGRVGLVVIEGALAAITIRTMVITPETLTREIFEQLPKRELFDPETLEVGGSIWGRVGDEAAGDEWDFVVQFGEELCRCRFEVRDLARPDAIDAQAADYVDRWNALMDRLRAVPQLYIAT